MILELTSIGQRVNVRTRQQENVIEFNNGILTIPVSEEHMKMIVQLIFSEGSVPNISKPQVPEEDVKRKEAENYYIDENMFVTDEEAERLSQQNSETETEYAMPSDDEYTEQSYADEDGIIAA